MAARGEQVVRIGDRALALAQEWAQQLDQTPDR
jgi:hypothetical protein